MDINAKLSKEFNIRPAQVAETVKLIDTGNTIPFIARYRKEATGGLSDEVLRDLFDRLMYLRSLESRKEEVIRLIEEQGKLTEDLRKEIEEAEILQKVEDLYRPFRPKRRTRATIAEEKGLRPLAEIIMRQQAMSGTVEELARPYVNPELGVNSVEEALAGAQDIIAEIISDNAEYREKIRGLYFKKGIVYSKAVDSEEKTVYEMYYDFREPVEKIANHRILAINRGEKEKKLRVSISIPDEEIITYLKKQVISNDMAITTQILERAIEDSYARLIAPSIEREVRNTLTERAQDDAIRVFARNTKALLMTPPVKDVRVLAIDPGYRTGCKVAVLDETGKLLDYATIYPTKPHNKVEEAKKIMKDLIEKYNVDIISLGNGTASRETEAVVSEMLKEIDKKVYYTFVSEAGASVYSASKLASEEYPDIDVSIRGAISIGRRLQDPLAELVKIDPMSIGVGQYQHDLNQTKLGEALKGVIEDCVNRVGVNINTATPSLLQYVSGITPAVAKNIVKYRDENGKFKDRHEFKKVSRLGDKVFEQCAGFLRIPDADNFLDNTAVHPESYEVTLQLLGLLGYTEEEIRHGGLKEIDNRIKDKIKSGSDDFNRKIEILADMLNTGIPTLKDIISELKRPGRDPREEMPKPVFRSDVLSMEDLKLDMIMTGTVRNVVDFGAFVDIGVKQDGLVHISEMSDRFVKSPMDIVSVGDEVKVRIIGLDLERSRISLSMRGV
ncbi:MAG: Tex family protein [Thermoanaerobacteraceae bacterium]|nr:Tex family protein [Thermoanaerobacteraceae bacterium]